MTVSSTDDAREVALRALVGAVIVDQQPRDVTPERSANNGRVGDDACLPSRCPECCESTVDVTAVVYLGKWRCRFCGTQIRLAIGRDVGISDPVHGDLYIKIVRPGEAQPRPVPSSCLGSFRGERWRDPFEYDEVRSKKTPEAPPDVSWVGFSRGLRGQDPDLISRPHDDQLPEFDSIFGSTAVVAAVIVGLVIGLIVGGAIASAVLVG